jgi:hypothetical protein
MLGTFLLLFLVSCQRQAPSSLSAERILETAGALKEKGFSIQAARLYEQALEAPGLTEAERGNIAYLLGDLELNKLADPPSAYAHFLLAKNLVKDESLQKEIQQGMVAALERSGKSMAASQLLGDSTRLVTPAAKPGEKAIARIGKTQIYEGEVRAALDELPEQVKGQFKEKEKFDQFARQYVASRVVLDAARRAGLDQDTRVKARLAQLQEDVLKNAYVERELAGKVTVTESDARTYYQDHQDEFKDSKTNAVRPFDEVKEACLNMARYQKQSELLNQMIERLMKAADAEYYEAK